MSQVEVIQKAAPVAPPKEFFENVNHKVGQHTERQINPEEEIVQQLAKTVRIAFEEWTEDAGCKQSQSASQELTDRNAAVQKAAAKKYCSWCPVQEECLSYAIRNEEDFGVWGGLTERQLRKYRRRLARR